MTNRLLLAAWTALLPLSAGAAAPAPAPGPAPAVAPARAIVPAAAAEAHPNLAALAGRYVFEDKVPGLVFAAGARGEPAEFVAAGRIAADPQAPPADADSLWRIYSMTKPITGIAAMMLVEQGKLRLDQPVSDFIPAFAGMKVLTDPDKSLAARPAARAITIRHLLTHTAGLGYHFVTTGPLLREYERLGILPAAVGPAVEPKMRAARPESLEAFANRVATLPLIADPGTRWSYSIGLDVLARVIEVASGMPFDQYLRTRIFDPLDMRATGFTVPAGAAGRLATNYTYLGEIRVPIDPRATSVFLKPPSFPYGGAGLVSSARDYDRFLQMLLNGGTLDGKRLLKPETVRLAMSDLLPPGVRFTGAPGMAGALGLEGKPPALGFGAGGMVLLEGVPGGLGKGSFGWAGAAGTLAFVDPARGVRLTVMANYMPPAKWPLGTDALRALYADAAR